MKKSLPNSSLLKVNQINLFDKFYLILNPNFTVYEICDELLSEFGENKVNVLEKNISNFINDEKNLKLKEENLINLINKESEQIFRIKNNHSFWLIKQVKFNHYFTKYIYLKFEDITLLYNLKNEIKDKEKIISNIEKTNQSNRVKLNEISKLLIKNKMEAISIDIEKTKQIEISLKSKADIYFALNSSCIIAKTDLKGKILEVNHQFCAISKYSREELIGRDHRILNSNYHSKEFIKNLWQTIKQGKIWKGEIKNIAKDGSYYWVDTTIIPFLNEFSEPYEFLAIRHDISQIKEQQIKLEINELKYRELFENNLVAIYCINLENLKIIEINNLAYQLFGYESKEQFDTFFSAKKHFINFF